MKKKCRKRGHKKRGHKNVAIVHTLELNLTRLTVELSMLAGEKIELGVLLTSWLPY